MAIDQSKYPKTTNYDLFTYDGNSYANFVETLTPNFNKIDDQMKKNEDAASSKNQQIDEISTTVEQINQELPQIRENAEHAANDASAALASSTAASNLAQTANTAANSAASSVGTVATDLAELTSTVNTNTTNIQTNARNIQEFEESINTVNENYTNVNGKLTTTIANVQKLKTGFDKNVELHKPGKSCNVIISKTSTYYLIRVSAESVGVGQIFFLNLSSSSGTPNWVTKDATYALSVDDSRFGIGSCSIFATGSTNIKLQLLCENGAEFKLYLDQLSVGVSFDLTTFVFETSECTLFKLPQVSITPPS